MELFAFHFPDLFLENRLMLCRFTLLCISFAAKVTELKPSTGN